MSLTKATSSADVARGTVPVAVNRNLWRNWMAGGLGGVCRALSSDGPNVAQRLRDYTAGGRQLFWQRQGMYLGATFLAWYYFSPRVAVFCYFLILLSEIFDSWVGRKVMNWGGNDLATARKLVRLTILGTVFSAVSVSLFSILVARYESPGGHFTSLFLLFSAALFAAMYNHQLLGALILRLVIYGAAFIYIPLRDIWLDEPAVASPLSLQIIVVLFVLYFVIDCSIVFLKMYRKNLRQLEQLRIEHEKTKVAYEAKTQFLSVVSHELRTPLTSLLGGISILESQTLGTFPEKALPILEVAKKNGQQLQRLVNDLLDLQKMEAGKMKYDFTVFDLAELVAESVENSAGYAEQHGIRYRFTPPPAPVMVRADRDRINQVLLNILSNAAKFSEPGGEVDIGVGATDGIARVEIEDRGCGIPEGASDKVFGIFSQVDSTDQRKFEGSGLGMKISRNIMEHHGGAIGYSSSLGEGTTFFIELATSEEAPQPGP